MKYYKLTDGNDRSHNDTQWGEGVTHKAIGNGTELCSSDVIHVYDHPLKAVMFNPIHAEFIDPHLWECKVKHIVVDDSLKLSLSSKSTVISPATARNFELDGPVPPIHNVLNQPPYHPL